MGKYMKYIKRYLMYFLLGPLLMIFEASGEFILPYINANIINIGVAERNIPYIVSNGILMIIISAFMLLFGVAGARVGIMGASFFARDLRSDVFSKIQKLSFSNIDEFSTGSLITRITNDITQIQGFTQMTLRSVFRIPVMLIGALIMSFVLNPSLARVVFAVVPLLGLAIFIIIKIASPRYTLMQKQLDLLNSNVGEMVTNERVIKSFVREEHENKKFKKVSDTLMEKSISALKMMILLQPVSAIAVNGTTLIVVWLAGNQIIVGDMELGTLTAFITYLTQILNGLNMLAAIILQGSRAAASDRRIFEVLNTEISLTDENSEEKEKIVENGGVEFKNVSFKYFENNTEYVLKNINLKIDGGSTVGIIGSTGSGKTTLVSLIPRLYDADEGEVLIDGTNVRQMSLFNLREGISTVLQNNVLFSGTVRENLLWGAEDATDEDIKNATKKACIDEFFESLPDGYDTELGRGASNLSGGQKQRLCIARSLLKKPKIIILDDSTSAVDTKTEAKIRKVLKEDLKDVTKIIIAQRITSVIEADKIVVMDKGEIAGCGNHQQLMKDCHQYRELYYSQKDDKEEV